MRKLSLFAVLTGVAVLASGCALIADYDFGKYGERKDEGSGGTSASSAASGSMSASSTGTGMGGADGGSKMAVLYSGQDSPSRLTVDAAAVYFTTSASSLNGKVQRVTKDGSILTKLATTEKDPFSVVVDATHTYWLSGDVTQQVIKRAPSLGGGTIEVMVDVMAGVGALTVFGENLYWTTPSSDTIWTKATSSGAPTPLIVGQNGPSDIVADASGIYWLNVGNATASDGAVMRADLNGMNVQAVAMGQKFPLNIAVDAGHVYWATLDGGLLGIDKSGKNLFPYVVSSGGPPVTSIAADGKHVYYIVGEAEVVRAPVGSLSTEKILSGEGYPQDIAIDEENLYVAVKGELSSQNTVLKFLK